MEQGQHLLLNSPQKFQAKLKDLKRHSFKEAFPSRTRGPRLWHTLSKHFVSPSGHVTNAVIVYLDDVPFSFTSPALSDVVATLNSMWPLKFKRKLNPIKQNKNPCLRLTSYISSAQ